MAWCADLKGEGEAEYGRGSHLPVPAHTHSPCLSLEGKQSAFTGLSCQVPLFSFYSASPSNGPVSQSSSSSRKEKLARNKSGGYLKRIKCGFFFSPLQFFLFVCFLIFISRSGLDEGSTSRFGVMHSAVSLSQSLGRAGGEELRPRRSSQRLPTPGVAPLRGR